MDKTVNWLPMCHHYILVPPHNTIPNDRPNVTLIPFNYAGSESILTSLWEIDEESSSKIIQSFYNYLSKGLPKDEALRKAKLDYIATAKGRTASPQYWAGLVLIGDTAPIEFKNSSTILYSILGGIFLVLLLFWFLKKKK